ncbi:ribokinase [Saccharibacillus kuerlensis]|uniref:Ribokinase n=1 Tax=Saccharibacillus kuerlensis TaxID=459527 RepID=A0ABQ2LBZ5_9BACL|nr:ribokinase [Saccharibacillus kuerlensis]GGO09795.1 ribokinase [Saccharibacillus kuerlensis]
MNKKESERLSCEKNTAPRIVVVGSLNMDIVTESERAPEQGETLLGTAMHLLPGGKGANQAVCAARLGAQVSMIGAVGTDGFGEEMTGALKREGIDTSRVLRREGTPSGAASIWLAGGDNRIVVYPGANGSLSVEELAAPECVRLLQEADAVLIQLEIPLDAAERAASIAREGGAIVVLNPAPAAALPDALLRSASVLTPNLGELAILTGESAGGEERLHEAAQKLAAASCGAVVTTLGEAGALVLEQQGQEPKVIPAVQAGPVVDTTGAGDCFSAALAVALARGKGLPEAARYAACAAALAVTRLGAQDGMPAEADVRRLYSAGS